jgi:Na+/H+ antiporter NhaC
MFLLLIGTMVILQVPVTGWFLFGQGLSVMVSCLLFGEKFVFVVLFCQKGFGMSLMKVVRFGFLPEQFSGV